MVRLVLGKEGKVFFLGTVDWQERKKEGRKGEYYIYCTVRYLPTYLVFLPAAITEESTVLVEPKITDAKVRQLCMYHLSNHRGLLG